jgi:hypothetical protein
MFEFVIFLFAIVALVSFSALMGVLVCLLVKIIKEEFKDGN